VKQCYSKFPLKWLRTQVSDKERGSTAFATTEIEDVNGAVTVVRAAVWKDHKAQCMISTFGDSREGAPAVKAYLKSNDDNTDVFHVAYSVPRPHIIAETHDCLNAWCVWRTRRAAPPSLCLTQSASRLLCARYSYHSSRRCATRAVTSTIIFDKESWGWRTTSRHNAGGTAHSAPCWAWSP
jgi:hypothetical protein